METKKKAMISQPMNGKTDEEIKEARERAIKYLEERDIEVVDTFFNDEFAAKTDEELREDGIVNKSLYFLSKSFEAMSLCDIAYFVKGWDKARGCKIEYEVATNYGLEIIKE